MKIANKKIPLLLIMAIAVTSLLSINGCKKEKDPELRKTVYNFKVKDVLGVAGTATFTETSSTITTITLKLTGASAENHPAHIHMSSAVEGGSIVLSLNPVDENGNSVTEITRLDDNTPINYSQLILYDGYLNVHQSSSNLNTIIAQTDIGGNEFSGTEKSYTLSAQNNSGVTGSALFQKRKNGFTLVTISVTGTLQGDNYPAHIHLGSVNTVGGGPITRDLEDVDGSTGKSYTNIRELNNNTSISYDQWLQYDGYVNIHDSGSGNDIISQGDIGSNVQ